MQDPALLEAVLDQVDRAIFVIDTDDASIVDCNQATLDHLGYTRDELLDLTVFDVEQTFSSYDVWYEQVKELRDRDRIEMNGTHRLKSGELVPVSVDVKSLNLDGQEYLLAFVERRDEEPDDSLSLAQKFMHYRRLYEKAPVGQFEIDASELYQKVQEMKESGIEDFRAYFEKDPQRIFEFLDTIELGSVNNTLLEMVEAPNTEYFRNNFMELLAPETFDSVESVFVDFTEEITESQEIIKLQTFGGDELWCEVDFVSVEHDSEFYSEIFASVKDITERKRKDSQLARQERDYRQLVSNVPGLVYQCEYGDDWTLNYLSDNAAELTGYDSGELLDDENPDYIDLVHDDDCPRIASAVQEAVEAREPFEIEYRIVKSNDEVAWMYERGQAIYDDGEVQHIQGVTLDITERKQIEQELRENEQRFRALFEEAKVGMAELSFDGKWLNVNERLQQMLGYEEEEFLAMDSCTDVNHPEEIGRDEDKRRKLKEGKIDSFTVEKRFQKKNGEYIWTELTANRIEAENQENPYIVSIIHDIDERKQAQEELKRSEKRFRSLFEQAAVGIAIVEPDGTFSRVNETFADLLGYSEDSLQEMSFREITHPDHLEEDLENSEKLLNGEKDSYTIEKRYVKKNGEPLWAKLTVAIVRESNGEPDYFVSVIEDITERKRAQEALRKSEERYRGLFETSRDAIMTIEPPNFYFTSGNPAAVEMFRAEDLEEFTSHAPWDCSPEYQPDGQSSREKAKEKIEQALEEGSAFFEWRHKRLDGEEFPATVLLNRVEISGKQVVQATVRDITERKQAENELRKSEEKFRQIAENVDDVIWLKDPETEEVEYVSPAYETIWGRPMEEFEENPRAWLEGIHPEDRERVLKNVIERQKAGEYREEYRVIQPDGEVRWVLDRAFPIEDDKGNVTRLAGMAEDITERKQIREEKEMFFDLTLDLFAIADFEGNFLEVNQAFTETTGYSKGELTSRPYTELVHPDDRQDTRDAMGKLAEGMRIEDFENRYITDDGEVRWLSWRAMPGENVIYAVARDVTDRKAFERQLQDMIDEKETLLEEVHHRVKNNLQIISSLLEMQKRRIDDRQTVHTLSDSIQRVKSMALIHEQLYQSDNLASISVEDYLKDLVDRLLRVQGVNSETVNFDLAVDRNRIDLDLAIPCGLILNELISNALEHGGAEESNTDVAVELKRINPETFKMVVSDNGQGFPDDFSLDESDSLGMRVVRSLAEYELEGNIEVENNGGATVTITFPFSSEETVG